MAKGQLSFGKENIDDIRQAWAEEEKRDPDGTLLGGQQYRMVHRNRDCDLNITDKSIKSCAEALLRSLGVSK